MATKTREKKEARYRVEIVEIKTGKVVSVIGKNMTQKKADEREILGMTRENLDAYFVRTVEE